MSWKSDSVLEKLSTAALLHDISFEDDDMARKHDLEHPSRWNPSEKNYFEKQPLESSKLSRNLQGLPPDIDSMIGSHHELPSGKGYPKGVGALQISQISALFNIAQDIVHVLFQNELDPKAILDYTNAKAELFQKGNYKQPFSTIDQYFKNLT